MSQPSEKILQFRPRGQPEIKQLQTPSAQSWNPEEANIAWEIFFENWKGPIIKVPQPKVTAMADDALTDAKIAASEARNDTKIAQITGKLDLVLSKLDAAQDETRTAFSHIKDDNRAVRANQWVIAVGLAILIVAVVALFPVFFGIGTQVKDMVDHAVESHFTPKK